jgi:plastocyanin domain-containing protein
MKGPMSFPKIAVASLLAMFLSIGACDKKSDASADSIGPAAPGELRVVASEHGFTPASLAIPKGNAGSMATVNFVRTTDQTCATEVVFPDLNIKKPLPLNQIVPVNVPSDAPRTLAFQCGMGMYKGALLVK